MKIGLVCPYNMWGNGGVQECVSSVADELERRGHEVRIITPMPRGFKGRVPKRILTAGMSANVRAFFNTQSQWSASIDSEAIHRMLDQEKFDVIHFHEPWVPIVSRQVLTRSKSVNVATSHAKIPDGLTNKALVNMFSSYTKSLIKCIDAYSAVSEPAAEYIKGFVDDKIEIIPNGINLSRYQPTAKKPSKYKTILYIGRLEKRKGVIYLLEAFKEVAKHHPEARLRIAGDGELRTKFEQWVKEHRVPRVEFLGFVSENRKHKLLNEADLFCSPALYGESFGIVLLEAMAMGLVTVAGDNPGYASVMRSKGKVSLVDPRNTHAFAKKLEMFLYDEKERDDWKKWALEYVKQFDYPKIVDKYERLYKHGLKNAKR
jgi:phosphatidylinositol alpha-mannosyltransferase